MEHFEPGSKADSIELREDVLGYIGVSERVFNRGESVSRGLMLLGWAIILSARCLAYALVVSSRHNK